MKIGLICPYNIFKNGGVQECVLNLQKELNKRGHTAVIIAPAPRKTDVSGHKGVIFIGGLIDMNYPFQTTAQISLSIESKRIRRLMVEEKFDILHFHEPWVPMMSPQILSASNAVNIATFHAKLPETKVTKILEQVIEPYARLVMKKIDGLTAVSDEAAIYVRGITKRRVEIIPNCVDFEKYHLRKKSRSQMKKTIVYIGRLEKRKGVKYLLKAFEVLSEKQKNVFLEIAGDGPEREKLEKYVVKKNLNNVKFLGFVSEEEKVRMYDRAIVFCSPALYGESFGIVLLEAMARGVVIVCGNNSGYKSVMKGFGHKSVIDPKETADFAKKLDSMIFDEKLRKSWTDWSQKYISNFGVEKIVDQYETEYQRHINGKSKKEN